MSESAPLRNDLAEGPDGGVATWATAPDGVRLRIGGWRAGTKGTVLLFTGRTEYVEKYGRIAAAFAEHGLSTLAIDWRGQGLSDRVADDPMLGHVGRFSDYQLDAQACVETARTLGFPEPFHLLAHSMGGAIGLRALMKGLPVKTAVFSGPMWGINFPVWLRPMTGLILSGGTILGMEMSYAPGTGPKPYPFRQPFKGNRLTTDAESYEWMRGHIRAEPRFGLGGPSISWLRQAIDDAADLQTVPAPPCPVLTIIGGREDTVDPVAIRRLSDRWDGARFEVIEGALHEAMMETPPMRAEFVRLALETFEAG